MNASKSEKLKNITKILNGFNKLNLCPSCESRNLFLTGETSVLQLMAR